MADRTVKVRLDADSGPYVRAVERAARATDDLRRRLDRVDGRRIDVDVIVHERRAIGSLNAIDRASRGAAGGLTLAARAGGDLASITGSAGPFGPGAAAGVLALGRAWLQLGANATVASAGGAALTATWGLLAGAVSTLPAALALVAAPAGAVALGLDGIKDAASRLTPEARALRLAVADTFRREMVPTFETLARIFPTAEAGFTRTASALSRLSLALAESATSTGNLARLDETFTNVSDALDDMGPGLDATVAGLLRVTAQAAGFEVLSTTVDRFGAAFEQSVIRTVADGTLPRALSGLADVFGEVTEGAVALVENGLRVLDGAAPGTAALLDDLASHFAQYDWQRLGEAAGTALAGIGAAIDGIDPSTITAIEDAFSRWGDMWADPAVQGNIRGIADSLPGVMDALDGASRDFLAAAETASQAVSVFGTADRKFREHMDGIMSAAREFGEDSGLRDSAFARWLRDLDQDIDEALGTAPERLRSLGAATISALNEGLQGGTDAIIETARRLGVELPEVIATGIRSSGGGSFRTLGDDLVSTVQAAVNVASQYQVAIGANLDPTRQALLTIPGLSAAVQAVTPIDADVIPFVSALASAVAAGNASSSTGRHLANVIPAIGEILRATGVGNASRSQGAHAVSILPALGAIADAVARGNAARSTMGVNADASRANAAIDYAARPRTTTISVRYAGLIPGLGGAARYAEGGIVPRFHRGGVVHGYSPGRDTVPAMLSPGEAIMRPEWTRAVGARYVHRMNEVAASGGPSAVASAMQQAVNMPTSVTVGWSDGRIVAGLARVASAVNDLDVRIAVVERQAQTAREGSGEVQRRLRRQASPHLGGMFG